MDELGELNNNHLAGCKCFFCMVLPWEDGQGSEFYCFCLKNNCVEETICFRCGDDIGRHNDFMCKTTNTTFFNNEAAEFLKRHNLKNK